MPGKRFLEKTYPLFFIAICTIAVFFIQYASRSIDDNRLTSWKWVFPVTDLTVFVPLLIIGIAAAAVISRLSFPERRPAMFLFFFSFAVSALFLQEPEVIVDASRYFTQAKHLEIYGIEYFIREWGGSIKAWTDMPLVPFMYGLIFRLFGETRIYIQIFTAFLFSMTVVLTYMTGKTLWDEDTGFLAGLFIPGIPYIFSQVPLMLVDTAVMFFLTLSIFTFIKAMERGGAWTVISSVSIFCAFFSKYSSWLMLTVLPVIFLVYLTDRQGARGEGQDVRNPAPRSQIISRTLYVAVFAGALIGTVVFYKYDVIAEQLRFINEYQKPGLRRWGESFVSTFLFQTHPFITLAASYSIYEAFKKRDLRFLIVSWLILLIVLLQIKRSRYVIVAFPMLALMASYGLQRIKTIEIKRYIVYCAAAASIITAVFAYLPFLSSMGIVNVKDAGMFLDSIGAENIEVFTVASERTVVNPVVTVPLLDLFTEKEIVYYHDSGFSIPFEKIEKSPLRFTWEYRNPGYYTPERKNISSGTAVAVISNKGGKALPEGIEEKLKGHRKARVFNTSTGIFRYSPVVTVYLP